MVRILNIVFSLSHQLDNMGKQSLHGTMDLLYAGPHAQLRIDRPMDNSIEACFQAMFGIFRARPSGFKRKHSWGNQGVVDVLLSIVIWTYPDYTVLKNIYQVKRALFAREQLSFFTFSQRSTERLLD